MNAPLPDAQAVAETVKVWGAANPHFAARLAAGMPTVQALTRLGLELQRGNQIPEAIAVLRAALALTPNDPVPWCNYAMALDRGNFPAESAAGLEHSLALSRQQPDTWLLLGMVRKKLGEVGAAEAAFRAALELDSNSSAAWQLLGLLKQEQKDFAGAADCLNACVQAGGADAAVLANLGKLLFQLGRFLEADDAYQRAAALDPVNPHYRQMLRQTGFLRAMIQGGATDAAIADYQNAFAPAERPTEKDLETWLGSAFSQLSGFGYLDAAARLGRKLIELWPDRSDTQYLLKAVAGDSALERSTPEYVVGHFDAFAEGFEAKLVGALGYDVPEKLGATLREFVVAGHPHTALDAGCGTGLCGPYLRPLSRELIGVDLSPKMLEQAARRKIYDALICEELIAYLQKSPKRFDLIVAADVMVYFGELASLVGALATALQPGGLLAFSTESWAGEGYRLQPSGRFAQAPAYVRSAAAAAFVEISCVATTLRLEATGRLPGNLFVFRRRGF